MARARGAWAVTLSAQWLSALAGTTRLPVAFLSLRREFTFEEMYHLSTLVTASFKGDRLEKSWCAVPLPVRFHVYFSGALLLPVPRVGVWAVAGFDL